ncbi:MAG TPA: GNAT family N-acetyltransferase [Terriglobales bacterium]|nr:GNAT family N-acetyltransferase [Terriglobales bacterium]
MTAPGQVGIVLETPRLYLRRLTLSDSDALFAVLGDPIAMQFYPAPLAYEGVCRWIDRNLDRYENEGYGLYGMALKTSGELIGDCGLVRQMVEGRPEIEVGYHVRRDQWRRGYATEAARSCLEYAFRTLRLARVISLIRPENLPSRRVAEKNGLTIHHQIPWHHLPHLIYAITEPEWRRTTGKAPHPNNVADSSPA